MASSVTRNFSITDPYLCWNMPLNITVVLWHLVVSSITKDLKPKISPETRFSWLQRYWKPIFISCKNLRFDNKWGEKDWGNLLTQDKMKGEVWISLKPEYRTPFLMSKLKYIKSLPYQGSKINSSASQDNEILNRITKATDAFGKTSFESLKWNGFELENLFAV